MFLFTCNLVLITSAGVAKAAAGTPEQQITETLGKA